MFAFGNIPVIGPVFAKGFSYTVLALNESVKFVDSTPGSLWEGVSISIAETCLVYLLIVLFMAWLYRKQAAFLMASMGAVIALLTAQILEVHKAQQQQTLIVYDVPKMSAIDIVQGTHTTFIADSALIHNSNKMLFHIRHNWWERNITHQKVFSTSDKFRSHRETACISNGFIGFGNKRIVRIDSFSARQILYPKKLQADILVLSKDPKISIRDLTRRYDFKKIIIDSSVKSWRKEKWKKECEDLKIDCYSVADSGAYVEDIVI